MFTFTKVEPESTTFKSTDGGHEYLFTVATQGDFKRASLKKDGVPQGQFIDFESITELKDLATALASAL